MNERALKMLLFLFEISLSILIALSSLHFFKTHCITTKTCEIASEALTSKFLKSNGLMWQVSAVRARGCGEVWQWWAPAGSGTGASCLFLVSGGCQLRWGYLGWVLDLSNLRLTATAHSPCVCLCPCFRGLFRTQSLSLGHTTPAWLHLQ